MPDPRNPFSSNTTLWLLVTVSAFAFCLLLLGWKPLNLISPDLQLGLLQTLNPFFWFGFAVCLAASLATTWRGPEKAFLATSGLLFVLIWSIPVLAFKNPYTWDAYGHLYDAQYIAQHAHLPSLNDATLTSDYVRNMPGYFTTVATLLLVTHLDPWTLLKITPIFAATITFLALVAFLKGIVGKRYRVALIVTILAGVYFQFHVSPQSFGFFTALLVLFTATRDDKNSSIVSMVLFSTLSISHPTSAFIVLTVVFLSLVMKLVWGNRPGMFPIARNALIFWLIFVATLLYVSPGYGEVFLDAAVRGAVRIFILESIVVGRVSQQLMGVFSYGATVRLATLAIFAIACLVYFVRVRVWSRTVSALRARYLLPYVAAPVILTFVDSLFLGYTTIRDRFFLFFLIVAAPIAACLVQPEEQRSYQSHYISDFKLRIGPLEYHVSRHGKAAIRLASIALLTIALVNFSTVFYTFSTYAVSDESIEASAFLVTHAAGSHVLGGRFPTGFGVIDVTTLSSVYPERSFKSPPYLLVLDQHDRLTCLVEGSEAKCHFYELLAPSLNRLYDDSIYRVYSFL